MEKRRCGRRERDGILHEAGRHARAAGFHSLPAFRKPAVSASLRSYTDASDVSAYAVDAMRWAVGCGYLKGSGAKLNPQTGANRAEVAVLLHRYLTK